MFFRNATVYQLLGPAEAIAKALPEKLEDHCWKPLGFVGTYEAGFTTLGASKLFWIESEDAAMFAVKVSEKKIAPRALKELVAEKVATIEEEQDRKVYRKERQQIQDDITFDLLPHTPPVSRVIHAYIDIKAHLIVVDGSPKQGEIVLNAIREAVGSLPAVLLGANESTQRVFTSWLKAGVVPLGFDVGEACELREPGEDGGVVKCSGVDLFGDEIEIHLEAGKEVHKLAMRWAGAVDFMLVDTWRLQGLKFADQLLAESEQDVEGEGSILEADLAIQVPTLRKMFEELGRAFGGWVEQGHLDVA